MDDIEQQASAEETSGTDELKKTCDDYLGGWKRAQADLANYRADEHKRFAEFAKFAQEAILKDLVAVMDSIALALASTPETDPSHKGIMMIQGQFESLMGKYGLETITANAGDLFDPSRHEAVAALKPPKGEESRSDTVAEEVGKGYALRGKTIRPARVRIFQ